MERSAIEISVVETCTISPQGADLLVTAFVHALHSSRRTSMCTPFPNFYAEKDDFMALEQAVARFPSLQGQNIRSSIANMSLKDLTLLEWLLKFRHSLQIVPVEELHHLVPNGRPSPWCTKGTVCESTKCVLPDVVMKICEARAEGSWSRYDEIKSQSGSFMAYHGTAMENLHSVLRCGLINLSNTDMQRNGSMYGEGIYLSTDPRVAMAFSSAGYGWSKSCFGRRLRCILVCEVANGEGVRHVGKYVVVKTSDLVKLRFVLLFREAVPRGDWCASFYVIFFLGILVLSFTKKWGLS